MLYLREENTKNQDQGTMTPFIYSLSSINGEEHADILWDWCTGQRLILKNLSLVHIMVISWCVISLKFSVLFRSVILTASALQRHLNVPCKSTVHTVSCILTCIICNHRNIKCVQVHHNNLNDSMSKTFKNSTTWNTGLGSYRSIIMGCLMTTKCKICVQKLQQLVCVRGDEPNC